MIRLYIFFFTLNSVVIINANNVSQSRETAITRAIEKVGPAVASINVEQHISSVSFDPFFWAHVPKRYLPNEKFWKWNRHKS